MSQFTTMNVLVTGANGFVGRALCACMIARGRQVRGAVRSLDRVDNIADGVDVVAVGPIDEDTDWSTALAGVDAVVHLAGRVHMMTDTATDPLGEFRRVNVAGTKHLARMAGSSGARRFVFMSSIKVNGEGKATPYTEQDPEAPHDAYGISKWEAEQTLREVAAETGLEVVVLRSPLVYGPGVGANFLRLVDAVYSGLPLPLGGVRNLRSLIGLNNLTDILLQCSEHQAAAGETFLVSDGHDMSTPQLVRCIGATLGKPARVFPFPVFLLSLGGRLLRKEAMVDRLCGTLVLDIAKVRRMLNWSPPSTVKEELSRFAVWYRKERS